MNPDVDLKKHWGISARKVEPFKPYEYAPFRRGRAWLVDESFLLKSDASTRFQAREYERRLVRLLGKQNVPVLSPRENKTVQQDDRIYQLFDYVPQRDGGRIDYPRELEKAGRAGLVLAKIANMEARGADPDLLREAPSIKKAIETALKKIPTDDDKILHAIRLAHGYVSERLFPFLPCLERTFCHGDFHPENILWEGGRVRAVIDWEKAGVREDLYDLACFIGCVGMDDPAELTGEWTKELIRSHIHNTRTTKLSFELLLELVLAIRICWMPVWFSDPGDYEIAEMEAAFWNRIMTHAEEIKSSWRSCLDLDFKYSNTRWVMQDAWMVEEINKAKERNRGRDIFRDRFDFRERQQAEQFSSDLRLLAIEYGMNDDILHVCKILHQQERLSAEYPGSAYIRIEHVLTMGNAALDFSKFRMIRAMNHIIRECEGLMENAPELDELRIGYAHMLRNVSILFAETGDDKKANEIVHKHIQLSSENPESLEIKEELARSLSNALTSMLRKGRHGSPPDPFAMYSRTLEDLYRDHPGSKKIKAACSIARTNIKKSGIQID